MPPGNLGQVELMVLSALGWSIQDVTVASVLDTLVCLLGYEQSSSYKSGCYEQMHVVRESSRLLLAKAFRGESFWSARVLDCSFKSWLPLVTHLRFSSEDKTRFSYILGQLLFCATLDCQGMWLTTVALALQTPRTIASGPQF